MGLTRTEELLIDGLKVFGVDKENILGIMIFLDTEEMQKQLIDFMLNHRNATEQDILQEMTRIRKKLA